MKKAATVLVLGDPGPIRDELLLRREIDIIWASTFGDAFEVVRVCPVEACIIAPEFEQLAGFEGFRTAMGDVPCLVRSASRAPTTSVWPAVDVEPVLAFLARNTGLVFARYPRASLIVPVSVDVHGQQYHLETINLSVSGVAIRGFPPVDPGTRAELCLELPDRTIYLLARVVRVLDEGTEVHAGLSFTDVSEGLRRSLAQCVEEVLPDDAAETRLFGELEIPMPRPLGASPSLATGPTKSGCQLDRALGEAWALGAPMMRCVTEMQTTGSLLPPWFDSFAEELSEIERLAALGGEAPDWAHRVLRLRIELARARASTPGEIPPALLDEAYRTFTGLVHETMDAPPQLQEQVSSIRASLLRDVLGQVR